MGTVVYLYLSIYIYIHLNIYPNYRDPPLKDIHVHYFTLSDSPFRVCIRPQRKASIREYSQAGDAGFPENDLPSGNLTVCY